MTLVVFLKGINVGGHRNFRPSALAKELKAFEVVNVGAAGTFVVRNAVSRRAVRTEIARRLPFRADVIVCTGTDILRLASRDPFAGYAVDPQVVRFVSVLARPAKPSSSLPLNLPAGGGWYVRVLSCRGQFVLGLYRREMRTIGYLGRLEKYFGGPLATRNWNTILVAARILEQ